MGFFQRMMYKFQNFMMYRYGGDKLSNTLSIVALILMFLSIFPYMRICYFLAFVLIVWATFRMFSRNIPARQKELYKYIAITGKVKAFFHRKKRMWSERKTHKYLKCPNCKANLRVPRRKKKIEVSCPKCHKQFIKKA